MNHLAGRLLLLAALAANVCRAEAGDMTLFDFAKDQGGFYCFQNKQSRMTLSHSPDSVCGDGGSLRVEYQLVGDSAYGGLGITWAHVAPALSQWEALGTDGALMLCAKASSPTDLEVKILAQDDTYSMHLRVGTAWTRYALPFKSFTGGKGKTFDPTAAKLSKMEVRPGTRNSKEWLLLDEVSVKGDVNFEPKDQTFEVKGTVVDPGGAAAADTSVELSTDRPDLHGWFPVDALRTAPDGAFAIRFTTRKALRYIVEPLEPGAAPANPYEEKKPVNYALEVVRSGFKTFHWVVDLAKPEESAALRIELVPVDEAEAAVAVFPAERLREINPLIYGANVGLWHSGDFANPQVVAAAKEAGVSIIRYPGGARSQGARWQRKESDWNTPPADGAKGYDCVLTPAKVSAFIEFCRQVRAEPMITLNCESRDTENAADLVRFLNEEKKFGVKYFEIGNEPECYAKSWGFGENWTHDAEVFRKTYTEVARVHAEFAKMLQGLDPAALAMGPVCANADFFDIALPPFWERVGPALQVLSVHRYPQTDQKPGNGHYPDDKLLRMPLEWEQLTAKLKGLEQKYSPGQHPLLAVTEWHTCYHSPGSRQQQIVGALFVARNLGEMVKHGVDIANIWVLTGCGDYNLMNLNAKGEVDRGLPYGAFKAVSNHLRGTLVRVDSPEPLLSVYGAVQGQELTLVFVNTSPDKKYRCPVRFGDAKYRARSAYLVERTKPSQTLETVPAELTVPAYSVLAVKYQREE
jgi:hypothetical protein